MSPTSWPSSYAKALSVPITLLGIITAKRPVLVRQDGVAPPMFLMWRIYSPLPSLLGILTHIKWGVLLRQRLQYFPSAALSIGLLCIAHGISSTDSNEVTPQPMAASKPTVPECSGFSTISRLIGSPDKTGISFKVSQPRIYLQARICSELVDRRGIEPRLSACKADVLAVITISPYYKTCFSLFTRVYHFRHRPIWWAELDSNQQCTGFSFLKAINQLLYMSFLILYIYNTKFFYIFQVMVLILMIQWSRGESNPCPNRKPY